MSAAQQVASVLAPNAEQHLDANTVESGQQRLAEHGIVCADRELYTAGVKLARKSEECDIGLLAPGVGDLARLERRALHKQDRHVGCDESLGVLGASAEVCLQSWHHRGAVHGETERHVEDALGSAAVVGAHLEQRSLRERFDYAFHTLEAKVARDVEAEA